MAQNINLPLWANLNLAPTNNNTGATNLPVLANWPYTFSGAQTNNQPFLLTWGSNGVPYQLSLSNTEKNIASDFGTNLLLPYEFSQEFAPWSLYGTNAGFTNAWGYQTNFPITALFLPATNTPTLTDTDTVPIFSGPQQTNTTASLLSIYEYMTNKNALPPYTIARIQFSGFPASISVSNTANTSQGLIQVATNSFPAAYGPPYAVDIITNGSQAFWTGIQTNTIYYVVPQATNNMWLTVYSNYTDAAFSAANYRTNQIPIIATGSGALEHAALPDELHFV